jgi:hypothetical protein
MRRGFILSSLILALVFSMASISAGFDNDTENYDMDTSHIFLTPGGKLDNILHAEDGVGRWGRPQPLPPLA